VPDKKHRHLLFGVLADKEVVPICTTLFPSFETVTLTQSHSARAASVKDLAKLTSPLNSVVVESADVENGVSMACASLGEEDFLLIAGSITIIGEARPYFLGGSV
jgi:folylpolyglutamate synthase/dihydropteroate synthase